MWLIMCLMVSDGNMGMKQECTEYKEKPYVLYRTEEQCMSEAQKKLAITMSGMSNLGADYKSLKAGCKKVNDETKH